MATRKFLTSVADVYGYTEADALVFIGKTLLDSSIEVSLGSAPVRGGRGNQLQYIYYHTGEMKFTLTDTQWNLWMLGATVGFDPTDDSNVYVEENVAIAGGAGVVVGTPIALTTGGADIYGWAIPVGGDIEDAERFTFSSKNITGLGGADGNYCVRYYANNANAKYITINANMIPKVVKLVMETQLNSADVTDNKIGKVQIIAPRVNLSGAFTISMKSDGVSNTPLTGTALAYTETGAECADEPYYAKIIQIVDNTYWYTNVLALAVEGGDFPMANSTTQTLIVWAVPSVGAAFKPNPALLTFATVAGGPAGTGVGANTGLVTTGTADGTAVITCCITAKTAVDTTVSIIVGA